MATNKISTLIFHPALPPYRVDFFNEINKHLDLRIVFLRENLLNQKFDQNLLRNYLTCDYEYLNNGFDIRARSFRWGIESVIEKFKPEVVVTTELSPTTLWLYILKKFATHRGWSLAIQTDDNIRILQSTKGIRRFLIKRTISIAESIVVSTNLAKKFYVDIGFEDQSVGVTPIIRNEITFRKNLKTLIPYANKLRARYALLNKRVVLFVGRLISIKGVDILINAFREIIHKIPDAHLVVVGGGEERNELETLTNQLSIKKHVSFTGRLEGDELLKWYLVADLFVLPSHREPYGTVVNEALVAGVQVLCSSWAGASDLITPGKNGDTFYPYDKVRLSQLMEIYLKKMKKNNNSIVIRPNLMPIRFNESIQGFLQAVYYAHKKNVNK